MEERPLYIVDGGLATEIERRGVSLLVMLLNGRNLNSSINFSTLE